MPSRGSGKRHTKHREDRNRRKRERRAGGGGSLLPAFRCTCGFEAKTARGLAVHKKRRGHT